MNLFRLALACCLSIGGAGCNMCQAPYDYTGPTLGPNGQPIGAFGTRIGSVWADDTHPRQVPPQAPPLASMEEDAPSEHAPLASAMPNEEPEQDLDDELDAALDSRAAAANHTVPAKR